MSYDLLLVNTHRQYGFENAIFRDWQGVHLLAAYMKENGYAVRVLSGFVHEILPLLEAEIAAGVTVVGFACDYENQDEVMQLARHVRELRPLPVIVGGPQAVALGRDFLLRSGALAVVRGEGELPLLALMQLLVDGSGRLKDIPGIVYLNEGQERRTPPPPPITRLDALPFSDPSLALVRPSLSPILPLLTARGCPFRCSFCYEGGNTRSVRWRSVENVMRELRQRLDADPRIRMVLFTDDAFTLNPRRVREFCDALAAYRQKRDFGWFAEAHPRTLLMHPELLPCMVEAGLVSLQIGVESGDARTLKAYNKKTTPAMIEEAVGICREAHLPHLVGNIIVGGAFETEESLARSREFGLRLLEQGAGMLELHAIHFWPLPNTAMTLRPQDFGMEILDPASRTAVTDYPVVRCGDLSPERLSDLRADMDEAFKKRVCDLALQLPTAVVLRVMHCWHRYRQYSGYVDALSRVDRIRRFSLLLEQGAVRRMDDIPPEEIGLWHPQRQCPPLTRNGRHFAGDLPVDAGSYRVLVASAGRMTVDEAAAHCGMARGDFLEAARRLEDCLALAFCRY